MTRDLERSTPPPAEGRAWRLVALLLLPALWLRIAHLDWMEWGGDEEFFTLRAFEAVHRGVLWGYPTSSGVKMPAFFVYLIGLPLLVARDPVAVVAFVAALNLAALFVLFAFVKRGFGARAALLVTVLVATSPWAILHSRKIWNLDCLFPVTIAFLLALASNLHEYRRWKVVLACGLYALACQIHPSAWFLLPPLVAFHLVARARIRAADLALGVGVAALTWAPYLGWLVSTRFDHLLHVLNARAGAAPERLPFLALLGSHAWRSIEVAGGFGPDLLAPGATDGLAATALALAGRAIRAAEVIALALGIGWSAARIRSSLRGEVLPVRDRVLVLFAITWVGVIVAYAALGLQANTHYHVVLAPIAPVFLVWTLERWLGSRAALVVAAIALAQAAFMGSLLELVRERPPGTVSPAIAVPYALDRQAIDARLAEGFDRILHAEERRRERIDAQEREFQASHDVRLRLDTARNEPPADARGRVEVAPSPEGLVVRGGSPVDMLRLPPAVLPGDRTSLLRLELTSPTDGEMLVFFTTQGDPEYSHRNVRGADVTPGRSTVFFDLDAPGTTGPLLLRFEVHRYAIHALEIRALDR